jgi:ribose transport system substrate-binding protein
MVYDVLRKKYLSRLAHFGLVPLAFFAAVLAGCGSSSDGSSSTSAASSSSTSSSGEKPFVIGFSSPVQSNSGLIDTYYGQGQAAEQLGMQVKVADANLSAEKQVSDIDTLISLGVKGLIVWPLKPGALEGVLDRAHSRNIPVISYGSPTPVSATTVYNEQFASCKVANDQAAYISQRIPHAKVIVIGPPPVPEIQTFTKCFEDAAKAAGLTVLDRQDNSNDTASSAQPIADTLLTKHADADAIWAYNDPSALGAGAAATGKGKTIWMEGKQKGLIVMGTTGNKDAIDGIREGVMTVTWDQNQPEFGAAAVQAMAVAAGLRKPEGGGPLPEKIIIHETRYDLTNVDKWIEPQKRKIALNMSFTNR